MEKTKKQVVGGGYHRPVCKKCNCEMRPETNGVGVLDMVNQSNHERYREAQPYELWDADLWKCPKCGVEIVGGFGSGPISSHYEDGFAQTIYSYERQGLIIINNG